MQMMTRDEQVIDQVSIALPEIVPGQAPLQQNIVYKRSARQVYKVRIQLVTPTGYAVGEHVIVFLK